MDYDGQCKEPHGHNGKVEVICASSKLDRCGMVVDFSKIKSIIKNFIDSNWDHTMLLRKDDPLIPHLKEINARYFTFNDNPTAEVLAKYLYYFAKENSLPVIEIRFYETPSSIACYSEERDVDK